MNEWENAEHHAERASRFFEMGQWEKALAELKRALEVNPEQSDWHFGMGLTLDALERYPEAVACFQRVVQLRGEDIETLLHLAHDLIHCERTADAVETLERVTQLDPACERAYCLLILAQGRLGDHDEAEVAFYRGRQLVDECPRCYDHLAQSLAMRNQYDRAVWCWKQAIKLDPKHPGLHPNLAHAFWNQGKMDEARSVFVQQIRQHPSDTDSLLDLGNLLIEMDRFAEAGEKFRRALEMDPTLAAAHLHLGELALLSGHIDAAATELRTAQSLDPKESGVHLRLAEVARRRGQIDRAREHLHKELQQNEHTTHHALELAGMLIDLDRPQPAIDLLTPLLALPRPDDLTDEERATALIYRGVGRMLLGDHAEGIVDCRAALHYLPENLVAIHNLVLAHLNSHRLRRAHYWLTRLRPYRQSHPGYRSLYLRWLLARVWSPVRRLLRLGRPRSA